MPPQTARSLMKDFRNSFRRKKVVDPAPTLEVAVNQVEDEAQAKLRELKEKMADKLPAIYTDAELIGFLRARSMNVQEAEKLVKLDENANKILRTEEYQPCSELYFYNFTGLVGFDKEGCLVRVINAGGCDAKGVVHRVSTIEGMKIMKRMLCLDMAIQDEENRKTGRTNRQFVHIMNLENFSMYQVSCKPAFDTAMQSLKLLQDHYHDIVKTVYIVNAPPFFSSVYKLFKPVIQDSLQEKIKILDYGNWREELLKVIDEDVLPKYLGGNRVDSNGDPNCSESIPFGTIIPEDNYASNFLDANDPDVVTVTIAAGATLNYRFPVRQVGSILQWHIQAKDNDLGIGLFLEPFQSGNETPRTRKRRDEDMSKFEPLTPVIRSQCHICPEEDSTILWCTGNLVLHLDNSYSWMNSKEVMFKIRIVPPTDSEKNIMNSVNHGMSKMSLST